MENNNNNNVDWKRVNKCKDHLWPNVHVDKRKVIKTAHFTVSDAEFSVKIRNNGKKRIWGKGPVSGSTCTKTSQLMSLLVHWFPSS